jgi:dihydropteroate synthase
MQPVLRISCRGSLTITLKGLTSNQAALLHEIASSFESRVGIHGMASPNAPQRAILVGAADQLKRVTQDMATYGSRFADLPNKIDSLIDNYLRSDYKIACKGKILDFGSRTHIMGILNATPDSFSGDGLYGDENRASEYAREIAIAGADILDIGGESTRPGAKPVTGEEELTRIIPLIERLSAELTLPISVDTYRSAVAKKALEAGASIINDISGLRFSPDMANVVADYGATVVIMHSKGTPYDMQQNPVYEDVVGEVIAYLEEGIAIAEKAGVDREKILIDPGIGFGKTIEHNLVLLNRLDELRCLGRPIVLGTSRKKFIGTVLNVPTPEQRVDGTATTVALGIERGAHVVRVHDVARMAQVARMTDAIVKNKTT